MKSPFVRAISRVLIICMSAVSFQASAGLIGTHEVAAVSAAMKSTPAMRASLASQFEAAGLAADVARDRVAALTDSEVAQLAGRLDSLPAGATGGLAFGFAFVVIFLVWRFGVRDQQAAAATPKEPAKEPAKK
jgi:hypothetical protein